MEGTEEVNLPGTALAPSLPFPINIHKPPLKKGQFPTPEESGACQGSSENSQLGKVPFELWVSPPTHTQKAKL